MRNLFDLLETHPVFHDFPKPFIEEICDCSREREFLTDQFIFRSEEEANCFYILRDGMVSLMARPPGLGSITIDTLGNGDVLGWSWLYPPYKWHYDAQAQEPTRAMVLDGRCIIGKCRENHDLGYELLLRFGWIMKDRLMATRERMLEYHTQKLNTT